MNLITIAADIPSIDGVLRAVEKASRGDLPYTREAVKAATTDLIQRTWIEYASGATVTYSGGTFRVHVVTGDYIRSIEDGVRFLDDLTGEVFTTSEHGAYIEDGQEPRDMKEALLNSPKAKVGKNGKRYITVPFRHGVPGSTAIPAMPPNVYKVASQLGFSRKRNAIVAFFTGRQYKWNGRLTASPQGQRTHADPHPGAGYTWRTGQFSGMVRMGGKNQTQYLTFRRVSDNSDPKSWQHPGVLPRPIRDAVVENTQEDVLSLIRQGFEMDLYFMGLGGDS